MADSGAQVARSKVFIVDDDEGIRNLCASIASSAGLEPFTASDGIEASERIADILPDFVLLDVSLPGRGGMELLREFRMRFPATRVVMITGYATVDLAVEAMKLGAYDYIAKPFRPNRLLAVLTRSPEKAPPPVVTRAPRRSFHSIVGVSSAMQQIYELTEKAARSESTVLIEGESGTGKELVARAIHDCSPHSSEPFVPVDCGAIPATIIESELFGHVAGAYTDAKSDSPGLLRSAGNGSVFLDEIGEMPAAVQGKLLRSLQQREVRPVGGTRTAPFQARIIAATNRDLSQAVERGKFRRDLFYRLHVVPIFVPPLRERREDIPALVEHFLRLYGDRAGRQMSIAPDALRHLMRYDWPGNVRELENIIQRAFALLDGSLIRLPDMAMLFPRQLQRPKSGEGPAQLPADEERGNLLASQEARTIRTAIENAGGNKREAARVLGIGIATLYRKIKKYGIES